MKVTAITLATAAAFALPACDQVKETAADAAAKSKAAAVEAAAKAEAAMPGLKEKAANAMDAAKEAGADALESAKAAGADAMNRSGNMIDSARDWGLQKMGVPEADGLMEGFGKLIADAKAAVASGMNGEKAAALRARWDVLYAKSSASIQNLAPEQQEKMKAILSTMKVKWDELMTKSKDGAVQ